MTTLRDIITNFARELETTYDLTRDGETDYLASKKELIEETMQRIKDTLIG